MNGSLRGVVRSGPGSKRTDRHAGSSRSMKKRSKNGKRGKFGNVGRLRTGNNLVLRRADLADRGGCRYGVLSDLDRRLIRGGKMREAIIIGTILIIAVIIWRPRKGG